MKNQNIPTEALMRPSDQKLWLIPLFLFLFFTLAYTVYSPGIFAQDWDSLMYAYQSEVEGMRAIFGNHPLGQVVLNSIYIIAKSIGYQGKALPVNMLTNSILGGFTVAVFFYILNKLLGINYLASFAYALIFGASYRFWYSAGTAGVYNFSILMLLLAWGFLIYEIFHTNRRFLFLSGLFAGLSILTHQLNVVFLIAALVMITAHRNQFKTRFVSYYGTIFILLGIGFLLIGYLVKSSLSIPELFHWIRGYVGDPLYGTYFKPESIPVALKAALAVVIPTTNQGVRTIRLALFLILIAPALLGITQVKLLDRKKKIIFLAAFVQCSINTLLILWFEPWYPFFWLITLLPAMFVFAYSIEALALRIKLVPINSAKSQMLLSTFFVFVGMAVLSYNLEYSFIPDHTTDQQSQSSLNAWLDHSAPDDMLITAGDLTSQLWFVENRPNTVHLYHYLEVDKNTTDRFAYITEQIDQTLCSGRRVIFAPAIINYFGENFLQWLDISRNDLRLFFDGYDKEEYFMYRNLVDGNETQVYQLKKPETCSK